MVCDRTQLFFNIFLSTTRNYNSKVLLLQVDQFTNKGHKIFAIGTLIQRIQDDVLMPCIYYRIFK